MKVEGVIVDIHYLSDYDPDRMECLNSAASEQALKVRNGDHVKLFGKYLSAGSISTCGDLDYYIEILPSKEHTHTIISETMTLPTEEMSQRQEPTAAILEPNIYEISHWQEYEQALGYALHERVDRVDVICEWSIFGRDIDKIYIWTVCSGYHPSDLSYLYTVGIEAVVYLDSDGSVLGVGTVENTAGPSYGEIRQTLFPPDILDKFEHPPDRSRLNEHLSERRISPGPPLIVLKATSTPSETSRPAPTPMVMTATLLIPEIPLTVFFPANYTLIKNDELNRRGSFLSYDFFRIDEPSQSINPPFPSAPFFNEIQFFTEDSITHFVNYCLTTEIEGGESFCNLGNYPDLETYYGQRESFQNLSDYENYNLEKFGDRYYFTSPYFGRSGSYAKTKEYTTFVGDIKIDIWISLSSYMDYQPEEVLQLRSVESDQLFRLLYLDTN